MPYTLVRSGGKRPWKIVNQETGRIVGTSKSKTKAQKSVVHRMKAEREKIVNGG